MIKSKTDQWFWPIQLSTWIIIALLNFSVQHRLPVPPVVLYLNCAGMIMGGLLVTTAFRYYLKKQGHRFHLRPFQFIGFLLLATSLQAISWLLLFKLCFLTVAAKYPVPLLELMINLAPLMALCLLWNLVYLSYHLIRRYHTSEVEKWKLEAEVQKAGLGALKAQINPHFMFNALNNIRALILEDPQKAREMLTRFSETFRYALQYSEQKETTLAEEIHILDQFVELLKIQYEDKLKYTLEVDEHALSTLIPPMTLQLLVENAVKHGIALQPCGGEIIVTISHDGAALCLTVSNTGTLKQKNELEDSLGIGLKNITARLQLLYGYRAGLTIREEAPLVIVIIRILQK
jgi:two-component system LytT family sensor kinase